VYVAPDSRKVSAVIRQLIPEQQTSEILPAAPQVSCRFCEACDFKADFLAKFCD
jgi:hypothetical protein